MLMGERAFPLPTPAAEKEKRDSQVIIDTLRDTLEERNATVESLQKALDKAEMLCSTLKVGPRVLCAQVRWPYLLAFPWSLPSFVQL